MGRLLRSPGIGPLLAGRLFNRSRAIGFRMPGMIIANRLVAGGSGRVCAH
jgi:hypothetical protein